jgi:hypothetical protein
MAHWSNYALLLHPLWFPAIPLGILYWAFFSADLPLLVRVFAVLFGMFYALLLLMTLRDIWEEVRWRVAAAKRRGNGGKPPESGVPHDQIGRSEAKCPVQQKPIRRPLASEPIFDLLFGPFAFLVPPLAMSGAAFDMTVNLAVRVLATFFGIVFALLWLGKLWDTGEEVRWRVLEARSRRGGTIPP